MQGEQRPTLVCQQICCDCGHIVSQWKCLLAEIEDLLIALEPDGESRLSLVDGELAWVELQRGRIGSKRLLVVSHMAQAIAGS